MSFVDDGFNQHLSSRKVSRLAPPGVFLTIAEAMWTWRVRCGSRREGLASVCHPQYAL
jgi:hypothetical protein